jgi:ribose-phosphate pyrophosphokinase
MKNQFKLFGLSGSLSLANAIAKALNIQLSEVETTKFADGEVLVKPLETVRNHHVVIVQSTSKPATENLMELMVFIDALRRSSAKEITAVIPYYGFARQDRVARSREPITAKLVADLLVASGANRVLSVDIHTLQIQGFFSVPFDTISPYHLFVKAIKDAAKKDGYTTDDIVVVSPDHGSVMRARSFAELFDDATIGIVDKRRPRANVAESVNLIGDVKDKLVVMVDDIVDTGNTIVGAANLVKKHGAKAIYVCATHAVFSGDAVSKIAHSSINRFFISDTIAQAPIANIEVISVAPLLARVIENMHEGKPLTPIFKEFTHSEG